MKRISILLAFVMAIMVLNMGCGSDDNGVMMEDDNPQQGDNPDDPDDPSDPSGTLETIDVQVILPDGSNVNLGDTEVFTLAETASVDGNGNAEAPTITDSSELAFVFDSDNNPILASFISSEKTEISIATTAEVLLYYSSSLPFDNFNGKDYIGGALEGVVGIDEFKNDLSQLFVADPLMLSNQSFITALDEQLQRISGRNDIVFENRVFVDGGDIRDGLRIDEKPDNQIQIGNKFGRRAHAYVYEKAFTDLEGNRVVVNSEVAVDDVAEVDFELEKARIAENLEIPDDIDETDIEQLLEAQNRRNARIKILNGENCVTSVFSEEKSDLITLEIEEDEMQVEYEVSIVGPGSQQSSERPLTNAEQSKLEELSLETFVLDYLLPVMLEFSGRKLSLTQLNGSRDGALLNAVTPFIDNNPSIKSLVLEAKFTEAMTNYMDILYADGSSFGEGFDLLETVYPILVDGGNQPFNFILTDVQKERTADVGNILSLIMGGKSFQCLDGVFSNSKQLNSWEVEVDEGLVTLEPNKVEVVNMVESKRIEVEVGGERIEDMLEYEWSTTDTYGGKLTDLNGGEGTSFTSSFGTVFFLSTASNNEIPDGNDNIETITVTVYNVDANGNRVDEIGSDSIEGIVRKKTFRIVQDGAVIDGDDTLKLKLKNQDTTQIPNNNFDYRIIWSTSAQYGHLANGEASVDVENTPDMEYTATDEDVEEGVEDIKAVIYSREKGTNIPYRLFDEATAQITIKNDNKLYKELDLVVVSHPWPVNNPSGESIECSFVIKPIQDAESYSLKVNSYDPDVNPSQTGRTYSWSAEIEGNRFWNPDIGAFQVILSSTQSGNPATILDAASACNARIGSATLTVCLKPEN